MNNYNSYNSLNFSNNLNNNNSKLYNNLNFTNNINNSNNNNTNYISNKSIPTNRSLDAQDLHQAKLNFNEICNFKMEISRLVEENIYLKTQLIDIKSKISQYDNILERTDLKYQEQINNYQKQLIKYNNYIHEIYIFFSNITNNYLPELNFSLQKNESVLISFELFQKKLKNIENYIYELNRNLNYSKINLRNNTEYSSESLFKNNSHLLTEFGRNKNSMERRINNIDKNIINKGYFKTGNKNNKKINNTLRSKYHYANNNLCTKDHIIKQYRKISTNNNNKKKDRFHSALARSTGGSSRKKFSAKKSSNNTNDRLYKNDDLKFLKKSIPINPKRSRTPLVKPRNDF